MDADYCVMCGDYVPEGRMMCSMCLQLQPPKKREPVKKVPTFRRHIGIIFRFLCRKEKTGGMK